MLNPGVLLGHAKIWVCAIGKRASMKRSLSLGWHPVRKKQKRVDSTCHFLPHLKIYWPKKFTKDFMLYTTNWYAQPLQKAKQEHIQSEKVCGRKDFDVLLDFEGFIIYLLTGKFQSSKTPIGHTYYLSPLRSLPLKVWRSGWKKKSLLEGVNHILSRRLSPTRERTASQSIALLCRKTSLQGEM